MKLKMKDTIQGRILRALIILLMAVFFLSGLSLYTIFKGENTFRIANLKSTESRNYILEIRVALEQTATAFANFSNAKNEARLHAELRTAQLKLNKVLESSLRGQAAMPWFGKLNTIEASVANLEKHAETSRHFQDQIQDLRHSLDELNGEIANYYENEVLSGVRDLVFLIIVVAIGKILIPAGSFWLTTQRINRDLSSYVQELSEFSKDNDESSQSLRSASETLSGASSQQSASVQETISSITEIRRMLGQTESHVREVQGLTSTMQQRTQDGTEIMARMESAMLSIEQANRQLESFEEIIQSIRGKTQVINAIVFKTQLLSFNASIEAARAGQYGRGFAVVAEEVGKLAQMSGDASKEIDSLLGDSQNRVVKIVEAVQERVSEGKDVTGEALQRFSEIARQIGVIAEKINQVGDASAEQAGGIEQTARAMEQMNSTALENKRGSEELFKVAEKVGDLSSKIRSVTDGIRRFVREEKGAGRTTRQLPLNTKPQAVESRSYNDGDVLDIVTRLSQRKAAAAFKKPAKPGHGLPEISADDPSFKKMGPS